MFGGCDAGTFTLLPQRMDDTAGFEKGLDKIDPKHLQR